MREIHMEILKIESKEDILTIEGELDIEFELSGMHPGFPAEDKDLFNKATFEIKTYGDILLKDIEGLINWLNRKSECKNPAEWPKWKLIFERIKEKDLMERLKEMRDDHNIERI